VERLKDEIRTVVRVGMVDGRYTAFSQVKSAAEALDFELWRARRKTTTTVRPQGGPRLSPPLGLLAVAHPYMARHRVILFQ
jgi:hypothetical protein